MTRDPIQCVVCGDVLIGELDTFGERDEPMCRECFYDAINANPVAKSLFGVVAGLTDTEEFED